MTNAQFRIEVPLRPQYPLDPVYVAQGSSIYMVLPSAPEGVTGLSVVLTAPGANEFVKVTLDAITNGAWIEPYLFPSVGAGRYEVVGERDGRRLWLGRGDFNVIESGACGDPSAPFPPTGELNAGYIPVRYDGEGRKLYRKMSVVIEVETGEPVAQFSAELYRYNFATGEYEEAAE